MNSSGECVRSGRKADRVAELLARELKQERLENEAHEAALEILRKRVALRDARIEELEDLLAAALRGDA